MLVKASPKVIALMQAKAAELQAATRRANSAATLRRCAGVGLVLCGLAVVIYASCLGYAKTREPETKAAKAFMAAMKEPVKVTVSGEVGIKDGQKVELAKGGMVGVSLPDLPRPSPAQINADARPESGAPVVTNFVIFKTASYGKGEIQSGWRFADSTQQSPSTQWCAYVETAPDRTQLSITLGEDGQRVALPTPSPFPDVDLQGAAFSSCVWSSSRTPDRQSISPAPRVIKAKS